MARIGIGVYNIFFGKRIFPECRTHDVVLSKGMVRPMKLRCIFNKILVHMLKTMTFTLL